MAALDIDNGRLALAKRMGADAVINTASEDAVGRVKELTGGAGFGYVFDAAGNPATIHTAFTLAGNRGHICCIGTPTREVAFSQAEWEQMNRREFKLTGSWMCYSAPFPGEEWALTARCFADGRLKFDPDSLYKKYPLSQVAEAFGEFYHPENVHGKIMLINE